MATVVDGAMTTIDSGSPLVAGITPRKKKRKDVENAADARKPGDKAEDAADLYSKAARNPIRINPAHKGELHKALGVPLGQKIPPAKLQAALSSPNPDIRRKANFAKNSKSFKH